MFMKNIRRTVAHFKNALYNLLDMFHSLGPPTLFMTLSADDCHWPVLNMALHDRTFVEACQTPDSGSMRTDPVMAATHFDRRFRSLLKHVILGDEKQLGSVTDYFSRIEFQNRGSPHVHMFIWTDDLPDKISAQTASDFVSYIDRTIFSEILDEDTDPELYELVTKLQTHAHSPYCTRGYRSACRFNFPRPPCQETKIISNVNLSPKNKARFYITKRSATAGYINDYNSVILRHWRANMDIQLIRNAEGAAYYVCAYLCKAEPDELKNALGELIHTIFKENPLLPQRTKLQKIGLCFKTSQNEQSRISI